MNERSEIHPLSVWGFFVRNVLSFFACSQRKISIAELTLNASEERQVIMDEGRNSDFDFQPL